MRLTVEYANYIDARVTRQKINEEAVDERSGEESEERRPFMVFRLPTNKPRKPTGKTLVMKIQRKKSVNQAKSVTLAPAVTNMSRETLESSLDRKSWRVSR